MTYNLRHPMGLRHPVYAYGFDSSIQCINYIRWHVWCYFKSCMRHTYACVCVFGCRCMRVCVWVRVYVCLCLCLCVSGWLCCTPHDRKKKFWNARSPQLKKNVLQRNTHLQQPCSRQNARCNSCTTTFCSCSRLLLARAKRWTLCIYICDYMRIWMYMYIYIYIYI